MAVLLVVMVGLIGRMLDLSVFNRTFLLKQSQARTLRTEEISAYRGMLTDRNGVPLAISAPVDSIWVNPQLLNANNQQFSALMKILSISPHDMPGLQEKMNRKNGKEFVYLARGVSPEIAEQVKDLKINGVFFQREYRRFYPYGAETAQVLGFTNIDDNGQEGLELEFNEWLRGVPGKRQVVKDRLGQIVSNLGVLRVPQEGHDLALSLDSRLQHSAYNALSTAVPKFHAESGSIIVLDSNSGEVLAMANYPSFNPNARTTLDANYRNRAVTDLFEPGSTMKPFSIANGLASGKYKPTTLIDTRPGWMNIHGRIIHDDDNFGIINVIQVLQKSSNIGAAKITLSLPPESFWNMLTRVGFGQRTSSGFPGEGSGVLIKDRIKRPTDLATMAYGYGLSVTALQLVQAYGILASQGQKRPISFIKTDQKTAPGPQMMDAALAQQILVLLQAVAEGGLGLNARIPGYQIGGKTGTAYMIGARGYDKSHYTSSFIGIAPLSQPRLVVAVILHGVSGNIHFGAQVSAPVFATVMGDALRFLNIPPDDLQPMMKTKNALLTSR